jgi:hypothetical protein
MARSMTPFAVQRGSEGAPRVSCCAARAYGEQARASTGLARWCLGLALLAVFCSAPAAPACAQAVERRLVVLHRGGDDVPSDLRNKVDQLVLSAVTERVRFAQAYGSQVPFEDIELAAGCSARGADCMQRIAASLDADWILVRELARDRNGTTFLTLIAHDGPQAIVTRRAVAQLGEGEHDPVGVVPMLVERLYPSDPLLDAERRSDARSPARVLGWSSAALGSTLLVAGAVVGVLSQRDHDAYRDARFEVRADVDRGNDTLERAQKRARIANGMLISGAAASAAGAATLLWSYLKPRPDARQVRVGVTPSRSGVALSLAGAWRGGL